MALDKTRMGRRSNRLGSRPSSRFKGRHTSRGVMPLNQGSSSHGTKNVLSIGGRGGSFGSGRAAGGGGGAGALAAALANLAPSVIGEPEVGPGPVPPPDPNIVPRTEGSSTTLPPGLFPEPRDAPVDPGIRGRFPVFEPTPEEDDEWAWWRGGRGYF